MVTKITGIFGDRLRIGWLNGGVPPEPKMLKGHLPRVIYHQIYLVTKITGIFTAC